jgi:hypothetical protein
MNIADLFDDTSFDLELEKIKEKIIQLYNQLAEKAYRIENPGATPEEIASFLEDNGLEFKEDNSFEEESNELQEVLDQMLGPQDDLDPVKDMKYSKPTVETGSELKAQKDKKDLPEMSPLPEPKGLMATPSDSHKSIPKGTFIEPKAYSDKISKRKVVPVDVSYAPLIEEFTHRLADIEQRRKIGNKMLGDRL